MVERIVALDPGGTTGWAYWQDTPIGGPRVLEDMFDPSPWEHFAIGQIGPHEHHEELYDLLGDLQVHKFTVVCEKFDFRQHDDHRTGVELISREYIGVAKLFYAQRMRGLTNNHPVVLQSAGQAKGFIPDKARDGLEANAKLKALGLYVPARKHSMDAMRHLLYYMVNKRGRYDLIKPWKDLT